MTEQPHCDHECVCAILFMDDPDPNHAAPCENKIGCKHDTRSRPAPAALAIHSLEALLDDLETLDTYGEEQGIPLVCIRDVQNRIDARIEEAKGYPKARELIEKKLKGISGKEYPEQSEGPINPDKI